MLTLAEYVTPHRCAGLCGRDPTGGSSSRQMRKLFDGGQQARQTRRVGLVVWVDDWQMQCCGEPFGVGSEVAWTVSEADGDWLDRMLGPDARSRVDAAEDHHGQLPAGTPRTRGTVIGIRAVHCRYAAEPGGDERALYPVPGSGVVSDIESADGWTPDLAEARFVGYLVELEQETGT